MVVMATAAGVEALDPTRSPSQYVWDRWSGDELPTRTLRTVVFGGDAYLWVPTYVGLVRFDGDRFDVFNPSEGLGVTTNGFTAAARREAGGLWLGETGGGVFRFADREFVSVVSAADSRINTINVLLDDGSGGVWFGGTPGLYRLRSDEPGAAVVSVEELEAVEIAGLAEGGDGLVWVATSDGLWRIDDSGHAARYTKTPNGVFTALASGHDGRLWAWRKDAGLIRVDTGDGSLERVPTTDRLATVDALYVDRDGSLWLGNTDTVHRLAGGVLERWPDPRDGGAYSFTEDHEGNLWFTSYYEGLVRLAEGKLTVLSTPEGLPDGIVHGMAEADDGSVWVATSLGLGLVQNGAVAPTPEPLAELADTVIMSVETDDADVLWIGTLGAGLYRWDGRRLARIDGPSGPGIRRLLADDDGLWIGSFTGLLRLDGSRGPLRPDHRVDDFVLALETDRGGTLWVGTDGEGMVAIRGDDVQRFTTEDGLPSLFVMDIHADADGTLLIATASGVCRYREGRFAAASADQGLVGRAFFQILDDGLGFVWMTADEGISRVRRSDLDALFDGRAETVEPVHFDRADGLRAVKMTGVARARTASDGRLWFSTMDGVAVIDPSRTEFNPVPPPVAIEEVVGDGLTLPLRGGRVEVPVGTETLEIRSSGLSYVAPEQVRFRYRLAGFSDEWRETDTRRTVYFTGLAPGGYRFEVTACNNDGLWNTEPAVLDFTIQPRFTQTWMFYVLCALVIFLLGLGAAMIRVRTLKRRERLLEALVDERTRELADANRELDRMARIDGLTEIANYRRFQEFFDEAWRRCLREGQPLSVIMIDIDNFKSYNDRHGHQAGDEILRQVAAIVQEAARRPGDLSARYGGEEFAVVLTNTDAEGALRLAETVRSDVAASELAHEESELGRVSVSAGIATVVPERGMEPGDLIGLADDALYRAKTEGRNRVASAS